MVPIYEQIIDQIKSAIEKPLKRQNERKYAYYLKSFLHGSDLRTAHGADKIRYYSV